MNTTRHFKRFAAYSLAVLLAGTTPTLLAAQPKNAPQGGYGMGPGMMGRVAPVEELSVNDVKTNFERWLTWMNNPNLKLGKVKEKDKDTITAEIVTKDNSLVRRFEINRETGFVRPVG